MRDPSPAFSASEYERPNQPWVCGLASEGRACPAGPTVGGHCPALAECTPIREGDRWRCNRSAQRGGECDVGPTPEGACGCVNVCRPVRSLRTLRGRLVTGCTLLVGGLMILALSAAWRDRIISPGPLALQHGQILEARGAEQRCAACHAAADDGPLGWATSLVSASGARPGQSQLCLECHDRSIPPQFALAAHSVAPARLAAITLGRPAGGEANLLSKVANYSARPPEELACAACHREHQGAGFDLTAMDDTSCQACHQRRFASFADDHPDFGGWPYERRTRIVFDHVSHLKKRFPEKNTEFDCRMCHVEDRTQTAQLQADYEVSCAACHDENMALSVARGVPMFALPSLDLDALAEAGLDVGAWPEEATGDFDGAVPPLMKLLLSADPAAARAMATLGEDFEFFDVDPDNPQHLAAAADLARAIKGLLSEVSQTGPAAVRARLETVLGTDVSEEEIDALVAGLSVDAVRPGVTRWLPDVEPGNEPWPADDVPPSVNPLQLTKRGKPFHYAPAGEWFRDDRTLSIRYRPRGHVDPVLTAWLTLLSGIPTAPRRPLATVLLGEATRPTAPGLCALCHSVEQADDAELTINWRALDRTREPRSLTKFSHGPHVLLPQLSDCTGCHALNETADTTGSYIGRNAYTFVSEFQPMSKQRCAECHVAAAAGDRCQSCHNYHVETVEAWRGKGKGKRGKAEGPPRRVNFGRKEERIDAALRDLSQP